MDGLTITKPRDSIAYMYRCTECGGAKKITLFIGGGGRKDLYAKPYCKHIWKSLDELTEHEIRELNKKSRVNNNATKS